MMLRRLLSPAALPGRRALFVLAAAVSVCAALAGSPAPAQAQTDTEVWSGIVSALTNTLPTGTAPSTWPSASRNAEGYYNLAGVTKGSISAATFTEGGVTYTIKMLLSASNTKSVYLELDKVLPAVTRNAMTLHVDGTGAHKDVVDNMLPAADIELTLSTARRQNSNKRFYWADIGRNPSWAEKRRFRARLTKTGATSTNNPATGTVTISDTMPHFGEALTVTVSGVEDTDGVPATPAYSYQWIRVDGSDETDISGATTSAYTPVAADVGKKLKAQVQFTDNASNTEILTGGETAAVTQNVTVTMSVDPATINEGASPPTATVTVKAVTQAAAAPTARVHFSLTTYADTAASRRDFHAFTHNLQIEVADFELSAAGTAYEAERTFTLTIVNDEVDEDAETLQIGAVRSALTVSWVTLPDAVTVTILDDDSRGLTLSPTALTVIENDSDGATYTVALTSTPTDTVTVSVTGQAGTDLTVSPTAMTFTTSNWQAAQTVTVKAADDADTVADTATLTHTATGADYAGVTGTVTVTVDDDDVSGVTVTGPDAVSETDDEAVFTLKRPGATTAALTVKVQVTQQGAVLENAASYANPVSVTFAIGAAETTLTVAIDDDRNYDPDLPGANTGVGGRVKAALETGTGYTLGTPSAHTVDVTDDEDPPVTGTMRVEPESPVPESVGTIKVIITAETAPGARRPARDYVRSISTRGDSARSPDDYSVLTFHLQIASSDFRLDDTVWRATKTHTIDIVDDDLDEGDDESFRIINEGPPSGHLPLPLQNLRVIITDDDTRGVTVSETELTVAEGGPAATFTVVLDSLPTATVTVTVGDNADARAEPEMLRFTQDNWSTPQPVSIEAVDDALIEDSETALFKLYTSGGDYEPENEGDFAAQVAVTVTDNDVAGIDVDPSALSVTEGDTTGATYTVTLTAQPSDTVTVTVSGQTADLTVAPTILTFAPSAWDTAQTVKVTANQDVDTDDETVTLTHSATGGDFDGVTGAAAVTVTATDDDAPTYALSFGESRYEVAEGAGTLAVTVRLAPAAPETVTVGWATVDGTAQAPDDYAAASGTLVFAAGETTKTVSVAVVNDRRAEGAEVFGVRLSGATGAALPRPAEVEVEIADDDPRPGMPVGLVATPGDGEVALSWRAPGAPLESTGDYQFRFRAAGAADWSAWTVVAGGRAARGDTVKDLDNGTAYEFEVRWSARTRGFGEAAQADATPRTVPGAPRDLEAAPGNGAVTLSWRAPANDGGTPVTGYEYRHAAGTAAFPSLWTRAGADLDETVGGLDNDTAYRFEVRAVNAAGAGVLSASAAATPRAGPSAPREVTAEAGDAEVALSWKAPAYRGASAIVGYEVRWRPAGGRFGAWTRVGGARAREHTVTGLTNGRTYEFAVRAVNGQVAGAASAPEQARPVGVPGAPGNFRALPTGSAGELALRWRVPASNGADLVAYRLRYQLASSPSWVWEDWATVIGPDRHTVKSLTDGTAYNFELKAVNGVGAGAVAQATGTPGAQDLAAPVLRRASVDGAVLRLLFNERFGYGLECNPFTVRVNGAVRASRVSTTVRDEVNLALTPPVRAGDAVTVDYEAARACLESALRDESGNRVEDFHGLRVKNATPADAAAPMLSAATVEGAALRLVWDEPLDGAAVVPGTAFTVSVGGGARAVARVSVEGAAVVLRLAAPVLIGEAVTVGYAAPARGGVRDRSGNPAADFAPRQVENRTRAPQPPRPVAVALGSSPAPESGGVYGVGANIVATVRFDRAVEVSGAPVLDLVVGEALRAAAYIGGAPGTVLRFGYRVAAGDADDDGVGIRGASLRGGTIAGAGRAGGDGQPGGRAVWRPPGRHGGPGAPGDPSVRQRRALGQRRGRCARCVGGVDRRGREAGGHALHGRVDRGALRDALCAADDRRRGAQGVVRGGGSRVRAVPLRCASRRQRRGADRRAGRAASERRRDHRSGGEPDRRPAPAVRAQQRWGASGHGGAGPHRGGRERDVADAHLERAAARRARLVGVHGAGGRRGADAGACAADREQAVAVPVRGGERRRGGDGRLHAAALECGHRQGRQRGRGVCGRGSDERLAGGGAGGAGRAVGGAGGTARWRWPGRRRATTAGRRSRATRSASGRPTGRSGRGPRPATARRASTRCATSTTARNTRSSSGR